MMGASEVIPWKPHCTLPLSRWNRPTLSASVLSARSRAWRNGMAASPRAMCSSKGQEITTVKAGSTPFASLWSCLAACICPLAEIPPADHAHEDAYVALKDVFRALRRQLSDRVRKQQERGQTASLPSRIEIIERLFLDKGHGFIRADDGREIYFHKNSVLHDPFDTLRVGAEVRFSEEEGKDGPQASSVNAYGVSGNWP